MPRKYSRQRRTRSNRTRRRRRSQRGGNRPASIFAFVNPATGAVSGLTLNGVLANTTASLSSSGAYKLTLTSIPASLGRVSAIQFSTWRDTGNTWEPFSTLQDRTKVNMPGTRAIDLLSQGRPVRRTMMREMTKRKDASIILPAVLPQLEIADLFDSNFGGLSTKGTANPVDASKGPVNIKIDLTFV